MPWTSNEQFYVARWWSFFFDHCTASNVSFKVLNGTVFGSITIMHSWKNREEIFERLDKSQDINRKYFSMYSSWFGGFTDDPLMMMVPIDDHMVHRGDGVFEAFRYSYGAIFDFEGHWARLQRSAEMIKLELPVNRSELIEICKELIRPHKEEDIIIRLYVSRGPGSFTPDPFQTVGSQIYVVATPMGLLKEEWLRNGVTAHTSIVPTKPEPFCTIKSCNYLPNVMMKFEAKQKNVDFSISMTSDGHIAEGATENLFIVDDKNMLKVPNLNYILRGTTLIHTLDLADRLVASGEISGAVFTDISREDILSAKEVGMVGTTLSVVSVVQFDGAKISDGKPGMVIPALRALLIDSMKSNADMRMEV